MQLAIDFTGKKTEKITITVDEELSHTLTMLSKVTNTPVSKLAGEYVAECAGRDLGKVMILKARGSLNMAEV
jgi:hypothetical protein